MSTKTLIKTENRTESEVRNVANIQRYAIACTTDDAVHPSNYHIRNLLANLCLYILIASLIADHNGSCTQSVPRKIMCTRGRNQEPVHTPKKIYHDSRDITHRHGRKLFLNISLFTNPCHVSQVHTLERKKELKKMTPEVTDDSPGTSGFCMSLALDIFLGCGWEKLFRKLKERYLSPGVACQVCAAAHDGTVIPRLCAHRGSVVAAVVVVSHSTPQ